MVALSRSATEMGNVLSMILLIYIAPDWRWMAAMTGIGVLTMLTARPPLIWMGFALLVQVPNVIGLILLPVLGGEASTIEELGFGLRLGLGWVAAILFGVSLLSTMEIPEMTAGLRGLGLPRRFAFVVGYAFVLIYLSMADFAKDVLPLRMRELLRWTRPWEALKFTADLFVPIVATIARRGGTMAVAIQTMGGRVWSATRRTALEILHRHAVGGFHNCRANRCPSGEVGSCLVEHNHGSISLG